MISLNLTYRLTLGLVSIGLLVSSLEYLTIISSFGLQGVYSWKVLRLRTGGLNKPIRLTIDRLSTPGMVRIFLLVRIIAIVLALVAPLDSIIFLVALLYIVVFAVLFQFRRAFGDDGSDQMSFIVTATMLLFLGPLTGDATKEIGLFFIAIQSCISYATSGIAKLVSKTWRSGEAVYRILNTGAYGSHSVSSYLSGKTTLGYVLCWSTIVFESLFPLSLIASGPFLWMFLISGFVFHLSIAFIMGLNSFLWAFISTYPAIIYTSVKFSEALF